MNFREQLEKLDRETIVWLGNHELIDFIRIEILLEQFWDYPDFMTNLFNEDWDEDDTLECLLIYPRLKSKLEVLDEDELCEFFAEFACEELVLNELMHLDMEARRNLLDNL